MASIKLNFKGDFRRVLLNSSRLTFSELKDKATQLFPDLKGQEYEFSWIDDDGDSIKFSSDEELLDALSFHMKDGKGVLKLEIATIGQSSTALKSDAEKVSHTNVTCDECGACPIQGLRYKCTVRENFDLCERCESMNVQPYPMIKIYHPDQAPLAIFVAVNEGDDGKGRHGRHKFHHGRHWRHGPHQGPPPYGPPHGPPEGFPGHGFFGGPRSGMRCPGGFPEGFKFGPPPHRQGRWGWPFFGQGETPVPAEASFTKSAETSQTVSEESVEIEQTFIDQAIRLSVQESEAPVEPSAVPAEKLRARFVKDVTYPDGTAVQPGTHFLKVWRVRNDGSARWTSGCVIIPDGGDELCPENVRVNLPELPPGEETDIVVQLVAPEKSGRYVAYFRLQTSNGSNFGQRFWANIVVVEDQSTSFDWQVVSGVLSGVAKSSDTESKNGAVATNTQVVSEPVKTSQCAPTTAAEASATSVVGVPVTRNEPNPATASAISLNSSRTSVIVPRPDQSRDMATDIWCRVYEAELKVLRDMGFSDLSVIIPLLREHVTQPVSRNPDLQGQPDAASIQRVVLQLLGSSMTA